MNLLCFTFHVFSWTKCTLIEFDLCSWSSSQLPSTSTHMHKYNSQGFIHLSHGLFVDSWSGGMLSCEPVNVSGEHMSTNKSKRIFSRIYCWHWWNLFLHMGWNMWWCGRIFHYMAMDEQYFWMKNWMNFYKRWMPNVWKIMDEPLFHS